MVINVQFKAQFSAIPKVVIANDLLDAEVGK